MKRVPAKVQMRGTYLVLMSVMYHDSLIHFPGGSAYASWLICFGVFRWHLFRLLS